MIEFKNIEIKYGNFTAIENLSLSVREGDFFTFLGPSGCGKTTTLRALVGFLTPSNGQILIKGKDITSVPVEKRQIGMVFQSYALFPTMNVFENIAFGLRVKKLPKDEIREKVLAVAKKIDLNETQIYKNVSALSGGQQQRVALARAIVMQPTILCLDEPLSNLDAKLRVELRGELKRLQKDLGITTLYVTHDQEEALTLSDMIAVFNNGKIEQVGTPYEVYNKSASEFVCNFIGDINRLDPAVIRILNQSLEQKLDPEKTAFVRVERVSATPHDGCVKIAGTVVQSEYNGINTKYIYNVEGCKIKSIEKNDGYSDYDVGEKTTLYINPKDLMQF